MNTSKVSLIPNTKATGDAKVIVSAIMAWLNDPNSSQHCTVTGGPGAGKTWMLKELKETWDSFAELGIGETSIGFTLCGTTHDSLDVLRRSVGIDPKQLRTLYSLLEMMPVKGKIHKRKGKLKLAADYVPTAQEVDQTEMLLVCDEGNYIAQETLTIINNWHPNVRIIFVGSEHQLGTDVGVSKIFEQGFDNFYLNTEFRSDNADVQEVYDSSERDVINKVHQVTYVQNPSIVYLSSDDWYKTLKQAFDPAQSNDCIALAYTNKRVYELIGMIRQFQGRSGYYDFAGPTQVLRAGSGQIPKKRATLKRDEKGHVYIPVQGSKKELRSYIGETYQHYQYLSSSDHKRLKEKDFEEIYPSLVASMQGSTVHSAQGGTWDYTFLDLVDLMKLQRRDMETFRRVKHVAESRHRKKIFVKVD